MRVVTIGEARNTNDKWADPPYRPQRDRLIDFLAQNQIQNVIFLTGDMHNSYHAVMDICRPDGTALTVHELMSSPVNHFNKAGPQDYLQPFESTTPAMNRYKARILPDTFFCDHSNVMTVTVAPDEVRWEIHRTRKAKPPEKAGMIRLARAP